MMASLNLPGVRYHLVKQKLGQIRAGPKTIDYSVITKALQTT